MSFRGDSKDMRHTKFYHDERGNTYVFFMVIAGLAIFGLVYGILDPYMSYVDDMANDSGIPAQQKTAGENVWQYLPLAVLVAFLIWGFNEAQRRKYQ